MTGNEWHIRIEIYGDDTAVHARANLTSDRRLLIGHGAAPACMSHQTVAGMGTDLAVGLALHDLADKLLQPHARHRAATQVIGPAARVPTSSRGHDVRPIRRRDATKKVRRGNQSDRREAEPAGGLR